MLKFSNFIFSNKKTCEGKNCICWNENFKIN
jgi:hypothetical protein